MENKTKTMLDVDSSNIDAVCFLGDGVLVVKFIGGSVYAYEDVSREQYENILFADSIGKAFNQTIIKGEKPCTLIYNSKEE